MSNPLIDLSDLAWSDFVRSDLSDAVVAFDV